MTEIKKKKNDETQQPESVTSKKTCFIIMPIADHPDYPQGHFQRVYDYIIKPACELAGLKPYRADDNKASDMIMLDILQQIVQCDMAICDISSRNANVFFELGLRQAFNKKTILITDGLQNAPFDISGLRHISYSHSLRVDTVAKEIPEIGKMLIETDKLPDNKVNSVVSLLQIKPAKVDSKELTAIDTVVFDMFNQLKNQIQDLKSQNNTVFGSNIKYNTTSKRRFPTKMTIIPSGECFDEFYDQIEATTLIADWEMIEVPVTAGQEEIRIPLGRFKEEKDDVLVFEGLGRANIVSNSKINRLKIYSI
ncbi:hypothetical protein [Enterobacter roggenkampii]